MNKSKSKVVIVACCLTLLLTACANTGTISGDPQLSTTPSASEPTSTKKPTATAVPADSPYEMVESLTYEIGTELPLAKDFVVSTEYASAEYMEEYSFTAPGSYPVTIVVDGTECTSIVEAVDTAAPTATAVNGSTGVGSSVSADKFVKDVIDATETTVAFVTEPDTSVEGDQTVQVRLTDAAGNTADFDVTITIVNDTTAPEILGVYDRNVTLGKAVSYMTDVTAMDDCDGEVEVTADSSKVNIREVGSYVVTYTATDSSGNIATVEATYTLIESAYDSDDIDMLVDEVLEEIITDEMTNYEKAYAVYKYTYEHIAYTGISYRKDNLQTVYKGIVEGSGDCYSYYYVSKVMFDRLGIPCIPIQRTSYEGETQHFWLLVNAGDGWYHYDSCWHRGSSFDGQTFMFTETQRIEWTNRTENDYYYRIDPDAYGVDIVD